MLGIQLFPTIYRGNERVVKYQEGYDLAQKLGIGFMEISAKQRLGVDLVFEQVVQMLLEHQAPNKKDKDQKSCILQ